MNDDRIDPLAEQQEDVALIRGGDLDLVVVVLDRAGVLDRVQ